ncbi:Putative acyl-CoA dehydrogenase AidB [Usitatibacter rugosus]|uniref:Acyl-CoA dehydrogenase AidB n=1 Tax=Usitatibacter rugosus TaxID=2732067 RepID=A0A6M4H0V0_9PROT|nr:acyl-CoA dehydrogenase family protein [Usitatibacter rugosus]QJR12975.1 Putative acyl-CoA dehydrogenase AidB [Usitatibacter rugosus]
MSATHEVANQPPPHEGYNAFTSNPWLVAAARRLPVADAAMALGDFVGSRDAQALAREANRNEPELRTHDRYGNRIDFVEYHPSYHALMAKAIGSGVHSLAWTAPQSGFTSRAVIFYLWNVLEQGTACPVTMTFAGVQVLRQSPDLARTWEPKVLANAYDPRPLPVAEKSNVTFGMAMTEKQGGSDLRAVQTVAERTADGSYRLTGHKWFCSAPMSDAFFTLARLPEGVTCFFVPRSLPDGTRNPFLIQRLKDKCGNRSNASSEIEYRDTTAWIVGEPGRGIPTLIEMAHLTRFDIVVGTAGMMRSAFAEALHHARHREAFGKKLAAHPLMANVLADLSLEAQAAALMAFRLARAFDASDARERAVQRTLTPVAKYWHCKRLPVMTVEAMEVLGGNGYVEEAPLARLYREAPLNGIWEGSGNVICLDVLRSIAKSREGLDALLEDMAGVGDERLSRHAKAIGDAIAKPEGAETLARRLVEQIAVGTQAVLMAREANAAAADAFIASRIAGDGGRQLGTLPASARTAEILS